jgi:hypothetical protein
MNNNMSKNVTVIIPINDVSGDFKEYFDRAIKSVDNQERKVDDVIIVHTNDSDVVGFLDDYELPVNLNVTKIKNNGKSDFCSQVNLGVENCKTSWFSILEFDDEYSRNWFRNFDRYQESYTDVDIFLPLVVEVNTENTFLGFTNESLWAMKFSEKLGYLDNTTLLNYQNYQTSGAIYRKEKFEDIGMFKPSIKLAFSYEFLLRATYNDVQIMTIPKIGYKHTNMREWSLFWNYKNHPTQRLGIEEAPFWVETAKKEYFFSFDREISYENN